MSIFLKRDNIKIKNPQSGQYQGQDLFTEESTTQQIQQITQAGTTQVSAVNSKGAEVLASIPSDYTELSEDVSNLKSDVDALNDGGLVLKDEVISENVTDWLDDHPEATTTVQDNSLTYNKLVINTLSYVTPQDFGAKADGITDDTEAIRSALQYPYVYIPKGEYLVTNAISGISNVVKCNSAKITADFATWKDYVIRLIPQSGECVVSGIEIDSQENSSYGLLIPHMTQYNSLSNIIIDAVIARNFNNKNAEKSACGIIVTRESTAVRITNSIVDTVKRESSNEGVIASVGIHVANIIGVCDISNNHISNILCPSNSFTDADGVQIFSKNREESNIEEYTSIIVMNNVLLNCQGRFIKVQGENTRVYGNTCKNNDIELIENFVGIDLQSGDCSVINNKVHMYDCTGGTYRTFVKATSRTYTKKAITVMIDGNDCFNTEKYGYAIAYASENDELQGSIICKNNAVRNVYAVLHISGTGTISAPLDIIVTDNTAFNVDNGVSFKSGDTTTYANVVSENNVGLSYNTSPITDSSSPEMNGVLDTVYSNCKNAGVSTGSIIWSLHGNYAYFMVRYSPTNAMVFINAGSYMYTLNHHSDDQKYYYRFKYYEQL